MSSQPTRCSVADSSAPAVGAFDYSFDNLAQIVGKLTEQLGLRRYSMYWMDYGAPIGQRLALQHRATD